jgi:hypothetical protein
MRTFIAVLAMLAFMGGASAEMHGHGGFHGGGFHGGFHGPVGGFHEGFRGGGFHHGFGGFARPGGVWIDGVWCPWPAYYAGECSYD